MIGAMAGARFASAAVWKTGNVAGGGSLTIFGAVADDGLLHIEAGGLLELGGADKAVGVGFAAGTGETLALAAPRLFTAEISGFGPVDTIEILGANVTGKHFSGGALTLSDGARLEFAGRYTRENFGFATSGDNTDIIFEPQPPAAMLAAR
jgi:hypothetical protein